MSKSAKVIAAAIVAARKGDAAIADDRGAPMRAKALQAANNADAAAGAALVGCILATLEHGLTSTAEVTEHFPRCNNPAVYASYFNLGHRAQSVLGIDQTRGLIDRVTKDGGSLFLRVRSALSAALKEAQTITGKKGAPVKLADARKVVKLATVAADAANDKSKASKAKGTRAPNASTQAAALAQSGQSHKAMALSLRAMVSEARKLGEPEGREAAYRDAMAALEEACDAWGIFA